MKASHFINAASQVAFELQDIQQKRWPQSLLLKHLNSAQRAVVVVRPDATATPETIQLVPGTKQAIPTSRIRLLEVIRNMGSAGTTPGRIITPIDRESMNGYNDMWHSGLAKTVVNHYVYDPRFPKTFYVTPPVHATTPVYVEIVTSADPVDCVNGDSDIGIDEIYEGPIMEWMLYLCFMPDTESATSLNRAQAHMKNFYQLLGVKAPSDKAVAPWPPAARSGRAS